MGYIQDVRMSSINYNQDINKLRLTNDMQTNKDLQTRVMDMRQQGYSDQDIQNTSMYAKLPKGAHASERARV